MAVMDVSASPPPSSRRPIVPYYRNVRGITPRALLCAAICGLIAPLAHAINLTNNTGNLTFNDTNPAWTPGSTFTNNAMTATFTADSGSATSTPLSVITNGGTVTFVATQHLNALTINGGKTLITSGTVKTNALTFATSAGNYTGTLDLTNDPLILESTAATKATALSALQAEVAYGKTHTTGIISSTLTTSMTIAIIDNAAFGQTSFRGVSVDANSLLAVPAILGDANLDGKVDASDLSIVLANLGSTASSFTSGNFDGAATIDLTDLNDVLNNISTSIPAGNLTMAIAARPAPDVSVVPEPASFLLSLPVLAVMLRRRK
jgi:hypothetical protein